MATTAASLDGFPLVGVTPAGGRSRLRSLDGWISREVRRSRESRAGQDGDHPSSGSNAGRGIVATGQIVYTSAEAAALERRQMVALGGKGLAEFAATDALGPLAAMVEVDSITAIPATELIVRWTAAMHAPDPLLYGPQVFAATGLAALAGTGRVWPRVWPRDWGVPAGTTPGALTLTNSGKATYWPRLRIDGPVTNPMVTLNETGDWVRVARTVEAGQWLDVDLGNRRALLNGQVSVMNQVTYSGAWLGVPPGGGSLSWTADDADPDAQLQVWSFESAWH